jgi:hypothetical protein
VSAVLRREHLGMVHLSCLSHLSQNKKWEEQRLSRIVDCLDPPLPAKMGMLSNKQ